MPRQTQITSVAVVVLVVLATVAMSIGTSGIIAAQESQAPQGYSISIDTPEEVTTADGQQIGVEIDNTGGDSDLFSPIVEIPLPESATVSNEALNSAFVEFENGTTRQVNDATVQNSTFRDGDAVFLFGEDVFQGEVRTYNINITFESAGETTLEAETRLLYNEGDSNVTARAQRDVAVKGFGNITAIIQRPDGSAVPSAQVLINDSQAGAGSTVAERVEGTYAITASVSEPVDIPTFTRTVDVGENESVQFTVPETLDSPTVVGEEQTASVVPGSGSDVTSQAPTATQPQEVQRNFTIQTTGGRSVVAVPDGDLGPVTSRTARSVSGTGSVEIASQDSTTNVEVSVSGSNNLEVSVQFDGLRLGDANEDGTVNRTDAADVASAVAASESTNQYYDVNDDGQVTAVDAMFIAQFAEDNRSADYSGGSQ